MKDAINNYAFIDGQNLHLGIQELGWSLHYSRFRIYLAEKYGVKKVLLCIGYIKENVKLYATLRDAGYTLVFKPTTMGRQGKIKGNVDADMVLQIMHEYANYDQAIIVSGDGDFWCIIRYLCQRGKLGAVMIPNSKKYSRLIRKAVPNKGYLRFLEELKNKLAK